MSCPGNGSAGAGCSTWSAQCMAILQAAGNPTSGLVDKNGAPMTVLNNNTWGITYDTCKQYCNWSAIPLPSYFDFQSFSAAMTNYFLPWLALAAQLPFENSSTMNTFMAFCLALGSPALITYSLMITLLNRNAVQTSFEDVIERTQSSTVKDRYENIGDRVQAVLYFLKESQQVPLRATQVKCQLASLVVLPENQGWWIRVKKNLEGSRRAVTFSLVAQNLLAFFVWIFTIVSSFLAAVGNTTIALQIAAATLWIWLIPVTFGWIFVGTQNRNGSIKEALKADLAYRAVESGEPIPGTQGGIQVRSGLTPQPSQTSYTQQGRIDAPPDENPVIPTTLWMDIRGDEALEGPIYNYARAFTWWSFSTLLRDSLSNTVDMIEDDTQWTDQHNPLTDNAVRISRYCGLETDETHQILAYTNDTKKVYNRIVVSCVVALFVQWTTTGSAFIMAFLTPTVGLGCRSGGYMIYGLASTTILFLMISSMILSNSAMKKYQTRYKEWANLDEESKAKSPRAKMFDGLPYSWRCILAVSTRALGKTFAVANMLWLIISSIFEYVGVYNTCWCKSCVAGFGSRGWAVLFKTDEDFQRVAQGPWVGGICMSTIVCIILTIFFGVGARRSK